MYVRVEVYAKAKKEKISLVGKNRFEIYVKEPAERNLANQRIREVIAEHYRVPVAKTRLISGHHSPRKIISVDSD
ncbi:MAG: DUF167 domain-containing protein [Candidatus Paceibacterota bacterium]